MPERIIKRARGEVRKGISRAGESGSAFARTRTFSWITILLLAAAVTVVTTISFQHIPSRINAGQIAARDIKADRNYEIIDEEATQRFREEAMESVLPIYDFDAGLAGELAEKLAAAFEEGRSLVEERRGELQRVLSTRLGVEVPADIVGRLAANRFSRRDEAAALFLIRQTMFQPIVADAAASEFVKQQSAVLRTIEEAEVGEEQGKYEETVVDEIGAFLGVDAARKFIEKSNLASSGIEAGPLASAIKRLVELLVQPNVSFNRAETAVRRDSAVAGAQEIVIKIKAGEMIIREGARFDPWHMKVLSGIRNEKRRASYYLEFIGTYVLVLCFLVLPFLLLERFSRRASVSHEDHVLMALVGLSILVIMRLSLTLAPAIRDALLLTMDVSALHYAVPVAGGAMLLRMYLRADVTLVFAVVLSVLAGLFVETDVRFVAYSLITSMTAIMAISHVDRRSHIIRAGAIAGAAGAVAVVGIRLIMSATSPGVISVWEMLWSVLFALLAGLGCSIFTMIAAPIVESVSGYTSDIKLLELANLNHPLLRELIVRAPGSYHHSHLVGLIGEAAASAIGANALLVRVGAYYHDIGKLKKPLYFVENAKAGENRHERLTPHMSALIISAHVKDGLELAQASKIPKVIADMIPQHHGTRRISFFYDKAKSREVPNLQKIDPKEFQYPGPKPQTREAAILMLADVAEASVRALKEKSPARIEQTVQKTIDDIFNESQLDECDLTLRDLNMIGKAFARTLLGIYHSRIEYAKEIENEKEKQRAEVDHSEGDADAQERASEGGSKPDQDS